MWLFEMLVTPFFLAILISKMAFNWGSSKHGKAFRADVGSN